MKYTLAVLTVVCTILIGCRPPVVNSENRSQFDYPVAQVDTLFEISMAGLYDSLYNTKRFPEGGLISVDRVKGLLDRMLADSLTGFLADSITLEDHYRERRLFQRRCNTFLAHTFWDEMVHNKVHFDSSEAYQFYQDSSHLFEINEQVLVHQILVSDLLLRRGEDSAYFFDLPPDQFEEEGMAYALRLKAMIDDGEPFAQVAANYSHEQGAKANFGRVGWTEHNVYLDPFDSVAFSTPPGTVAEPYRDKDGWHILYIESYRPAGVPPWDSAAYGPAMRTLLQTTVESMYAAIVDSLSSLPIDIRYREELMDTNVFLVDNSEWVVIINDEDTLDISDMQVLELDLRKYYEVPNTTRLMKEEGIKRVQGHYVLLQVARDLGIDTLPRVRQTFADLRHRHSKNIVERDRIEPDWTPPDEAVRAYYDEHIEDYSVEKPLKLQYLIVQDSIFGEFIKAQAESGVDFLELARQYSSGDESRRIELVDPAWVSADEVPAAVWKVGEQMLAGTISSPTRGESEHYLVQVVDRNDPQRLSQVAAEIKDHLRKERTQQVEQRFRDRIFRQYNVSFPNEVRPINIPPLSERR